jgi:hypothetical protein
MTDELTVTEVVDHEAEIAALKKKLGDQGNEIGQLRRIADHALQQQVNPPEPEESWDFDPVQKDVTGLKKEFNQMRQEQALRDLESKHPGFRELPKDEAFAAWVQDSRYRSGLYQKADQMDFDAADELFTAWEESREIANQQHADNRQSRSQALKDAAMEKGSAGGSRQNYYSRTELIDLRINNPAKYDAMRDEIMKAYEEGRVRK